mgnify:CR=1 FL=1
MEYLVLKSDFFNTLNNKNKSSINKNKLVIEFINLV